MQLATMAQCAKAIPVFKFTASYCFQLMANGIIIVNLLRFQNVPWLVQKFCALGSTLY